MFVNLNVKSSYSLLSSTLSIDDIVRFAVEHNQKHVALTDFNVLHGAAEFFDAATKNGLVPVIGLEIFYEPQGCGLVLFAKTNAGYANLLKISSRVMTKADFDLNDFLDGVAVVVKSGDFKTARKKDVYVAGSNGADGIALSEVNCATEADAYLLNVLDAIKNERTFPSPDAAYDPSMGRAFLTAEQAKARYTPTQLQNARKLVEGVSVDLNALRTSLMRFPAPKRIGSRVYLQTLCKEGLKKRLGSEKAVPARYVERLRHELELINDMGFNDYFLIVYDFINWARKQKITVGPGRGSAVGSLVSYSLHITDVDPLAFNLIFERFLNPQRKSLPDIDIDIMDTRREEVIDYLFGKYGSDHVCQIITFQRIKAKMAIRDVGRVLNVDLEEIDVITKLIGAGQDEDLAAAIAQSAKLRQKLQEYPDLAKIAARLIGLPRQIGTHAAGIVLSDETITDVIPVQTGLNGRLTSQFSMEHLERFGLLKMDLLGLKNLTIADSIIALVKENGGERIHLGDIPLNDKATFDLFAQGQTNGIFQFESHGMKRVLKQMVPKSIEDLSLVSSLYRPGPQDNIPSFIARRNKQEPVTYISGDLKPFLEGTQGIIVYQEQVIQIAQAVAGFSLAEADVFRRAISKKREDELLSLRSQFVAGAAKNGYARKDAERIYEYILHFANYGFNHSHAIAYSLLGYWLAYFKAHHPLEFYVTLLEANAGDEKKTQTYVAEAKTKRIRFLCPSINRSRASFATAGDGIVFGFNAIKGVGSETVKKIIACREAEPGRAFSDYVSAVRGLHAAKVTQKTIETLVRAGCFDEFGLNRKTMVENLPMILKLSLFSREIDGSQYEIKKAEMDEAEADEYAKAQEELLGVGFAPRSDGEALLERIGANEKDLTPLEAIASEPNGYFTCLVKIASVYGKKTKTGAPMAVLTLSDATAAGLAVFVWEFALERYGTLLAKGNVLLVGLRKDGKGVTLSKVFKRYDPGKERLVGTSEDE